MQFSRFMLSLGVLALIGAGCGATTQTNTNTNNNSGGNAAAETQLEGVPAVNDTPDADLYVDGAAQGEVELPPNIENESATDGEVESVMQTSGSFEPYSEDKLARAESGTVVLAFFADWCPSCRALKQSIASQADEIPAGLTILELDYDEETELKQKYGVRTQHTLVEVDANGEAIQTWRGGNRLSDIVERVQ